MDIHKAQTVSLENKLDTLIFQARTAPYDRALPELIKHYAKAYKELTGRYYKNGRN